MKNGIQHKKKDAVIYFFILSTCWKTSLFNEEKRSFIWSWIFRRLKRKLYLLASITHIYAIFSGRVIVNFIKNIYHFSVSYSRYESLKMPVNVKKTNCCVTGSKINSFVTYEEPIRLFPSRSPKKNRKRYSIFFIMSNRRVYFLSSSHPVFTHHFIFEFGSVEIKIEEEFKIVKLKTQAFVNQKIHFLEVLRFSCVKGCLCLLVGKCVSLSLSRKKII